MTRDMAVLKQPGGHSPSKEHGKFTLASGLGANVFILAGKYSFNRCQIVAFNSY